MTAAPASVTQRSAFGSGVGASGVVVGLVVVELGLGLISPGAVAG